MLSKEAGNKAAAVPLVCVLSGAGWLKPQAFEEEMPSKVQAASQPLNPESNRTRKGKGGILRKWNVEGTRQINETLPFRDLTP